MRYQPIWHVPTKRIIGYEATVSGKSGEHAATLFRRHANHRAAFDRMLIELSMREGQKLLQEGQLLFINVHPDTLNAGQLPSCPQNVVLEITERTRFTDHTQARIQALRDNGVQLAMDDFGKQYSNLERLLQYWFYFDVVKLDRCFVQALRQPHTQAIIEALVAFCEKSGMMVIAEGVETQEQQEQLAACGIVHMQGYHLGYPKRYAEYEEGVS